VHTEVFFVGYLTCISSSCLTANHEFKGFFGLTSKERFGQFVKRNQDS
jgi:hypothetical protein